MVQLIAVVVQRGKTAAVLGWTLTPDCIHEGLKLLGLTQMHGLALGTKHYAVHAHARLICNH